MSEAAKLVTGAAVFGFFPESAEARRKKNQDSAKIVERGYNTKNSTREITNEKPQEEIEDEFFPAISIEREELIPVRETGLRFVQPLRRRYHTGGIIIHHSANTANLDLSTQTIHQWHINNGWAGCGYHYVVRKNGVIERGRPFETVGAHCYNHNDYTVGICVVGNFEIGDPTPAQFQATEQLICALGKMYHFEPSPQTVFGHRDFGSTACPGRYLYSRLPELIRNARSIL